MQSENIVYEVGNIKILKCNRCGYVWVQRFPNVTPKNCANRDCKSPYWNKPRKNKTVRGKPVRNITESNI